LARPRPTGPMRPSDGGGGEPTVPGPVRTCLGCRRRRPAAELRRLALAPGLDRARVVPDPCRRLPGRGAWVCHDDPGCLEKATQKGRLARALKIANPDLSALGRG
jgi:predicted RNA-binding protein YlxR (DUF448 family)